MKFSDKLTSYYYNQNLRICGRKIMPSKEF